MKSTSNSWARDRVAAIGLVTLLAGCSAGANASDPPEGSGGYLGVSGTSGGGAFGNSGASSSGGMSGDGGASSTGGGASGNGGSTSMGGATTNAGGALGSGGMSTDGGSSSGGSPPSSGGAGGAQSIPDPPQFTLVVTTPANGTTVSGTIVVTGKAPGFLNVEVWDATNQNPPLGESAPASDTTFSITIDTTKLSDGPTTWTVHGWDAPPGGNSTHDDVVTLTLTIDNNAGPPTGSAFVIGSENKDGPLSDFATATQCDVNLEQITTGWCNTWSSWESTGCNVFGKAQQFIVASTKHAVELSLAPWPHELAGQSWGACANGDYDAHYTTFATSLLANQLNYVTIRLGYEWDGNWFPWGTGFHDTGSATAAGPGGTGLQYAACLKRFDAAIQAVAAGAAPPAYFRAVMNPIHDAFRAQAAGLQQVFDAAGGGRSKGGPIDFIGVDLYDYPSRTDFDASMQAAIAFAKTNGTPLSVPEWGVGGDSRTEPAVDDNGAIFVAKMAAYMGDASNGIAYASYFNCSSLDCAGLHSIIPPNNPKSLTAFQTAFGNGKLGCGADARALVIAP